VDEVSGNRGRKKKLNDSTINTLVTHTQQQPFTTPSALIQEYSLQVSTDTVDRVLKQNNLHGRVAHHHHPKLSPQKRLSFAEGYRGLDWSRIIFTDEMTVWMNNNTQVLNHTHTYTCTHNTCTYTHRTTLKSVPPMYKSSFV
jgi:hypothetical protein